MSASAYPYDEDALATPDFGGQPVPPVAPPAPQPGLAGFDVNAASQDLGAVGQPGTPPPGSGDQLLTPDFGQPGQPPPPAPGLAGFDVDAAAKNLAAVGKPPVQGAGAPPPTPGAPPPATQPAATAGPPSLAGADADLRRAADEAQRARTESDKARVEEVQGGQADVHAQAMAANARANAAQAAIDQHLAIQQKYDAADAKAQKQVEQTQQAIRSFKFRDFTASQSSAEQLGSALAVALGALGAGLTGTPNYALQILTKKKDDDHRMQVEKLESLKDEEVMERTGLSDSRAARSRALADITMGDAAKDRLIAAQLDQAAARSKDANYQQTVGAYAAKLKQDSAEKDLQARTILRKSALEEDSARAKMEADLASARLHNKQAEGTGFAPRRGAAGHGGGGGSHSDALSKFTAAAIDGNTSEADLAGLGVRAGLKPNQVSAEVSRIRKEHEAGASGTGGLGAERLASKEADKWSKDNGLPDINKKQREIGSVIDEINNAPHNPLQQALAIEKAVSSARGGAASKQALELALHHLGGRWDSFQAFVQGARDGQVGEEQLKNFMGFMNNQLGTAQKEGKDKYDAYGKFIESQPAEKRAAFLAERGRLFSGLHGFGESGGGNMVTLTNKRTGEKKTVTRDEAKRMGAIP